MRAGPINFSTAGALAEILVVNSCERLKPFHNLTLRYHRQRRVAIRAAGEGVDQIAELETANHSHSLFLSRLRTGAVSIAHDRMHQQAPIACQQGSLLTRGEREQLRIRRTWIVADVDA